MNEEILKNIWDILSSEGATDSDFETWKTNFSGDEEVQTNVHTYLIDGGHTESDLETWSTNVGVKKKDDSQPTGEEGVMVSDTEVVEQPGLSEPSDQELPDPSTQTVPQVEEVPNPETQFQFEQPIPTDIQAEVAGSTAVVPAIEPIIEDESIVTEDVQYDPMERGVDATITYDKDATPFERSLSYITGDFIEREEEEVINRMNYHFADYGFEFKETGIGDFMTVVADNGEVLEVSLDPFMGLRSEKTSAELKEFLEKNKVVNPEMDALTSEYDLSRKKYFTAAAMTDDIKEVRSQSSALSKRYQDYLSESSQNQAAIDNLLSLPSRNSEQTKEYNNLIAAKKLLAEKKGQLGTDFRKFRTYSSQIDRAVGDYTTMKEDDGNKFSTATKGMYNEFVTVGIPTVISGLWGGAVDGFYGLAQMIDEDFGMDEEEKRERYITIAQDLGYEVPENIDEEGVYEGWLEKMMSTGFEKENEEGVRTMTGEIQDQLISEGYDPSRQVNARGRKMWKKDGGLLGNGGYVEIPAYAFDKTVGERLKRLVLDQEVKSVKNPQKEAIRGLLDWAAAEGVSDELKNKMKEDSFVYEGLFGLGGSGPSILLGFLGKNKGKSVDKTAKLTKRLAQRFKNYITSPGAVAQTMSFSLLQTDALMQEMEKDPDFKYVTETEKKAIIIPLAITTAVLERYGLRSIARNKSLTTSLMNQITKRLPKGATPKMFTDMANKIISNNVARGVYKFSSRAGTAAATEFETGALQQVSEIGMKNVWNDMYEKDMFKVPEMWSEEFGAQVLRAGLAESVGGFVMGTPGALISAFEKGDIDNIPAGMVSLFNEIRNDKVTVEAYKTKLDLKVANQEMTKEEAAKELLNFGILSSAAETVNTENDLTEKQTKDALGLVFLKNKIEGEMEGMDPDLGTYKKKQKLLTTIKDRLSKIGTEEEITTKTEQDAIQEPSTEKVDVQESTESSQEVGDGNTQGELTQESQETQTNIDTQSQEEVSPEQSAEQIEKLISEEQEDSNTEGQPIPEGQLEVVDEVVSINKAQQEVTEENPFKQGVIERVGKAAKALKKVIPNLKIIMHESATDFNKATGRVGRGSLKDGVVHINLEKATNSTVAHEAFHIVLLSKLSTDAEAQRVTKRMMESIAKALPKNDPLLKQINEFTQSYEANIQNEEKLAEILGQLSANYKTLSAPQKGVIGKWIDRIAKALGFNISEFTKSDQDVIDLLNTLASKVTTGVEVEEGDIKIIEEIREDGGPTEQGDGGEVGTVKVREQKDSRNTPKVETDTRPFAKLIKNKDLGDFDNQPFVTNMYDFTTAGPVDLGNGITINLFGGKSYVPYMMEKQGKKIGDTSNLAAFNTKSQAESFIRNAIEGMANLFMPHSGSTEGSWQFQQAIFEQLTNTALDNKILSKKDIINSFNEILTNDIGKKAFAQFKKKLGKNIRNFNSFAKDPLEIVRLLDIKNNYSPDLRKALNDKLVANKKFQEAIGVKSKESFAKKMEDVLNKGVGTGDIMSVIEFDNNNFKIRKPKPGDVDYHPSFAYTILSTIKGIYQPTKFYKSYDITDTYTKYNLKGKTVSRKSKQTPEKFKQSNVTSSAGAIPKVAQKKPATREQKVAFKIEKQRVYKDDASGVTFLTKGYGGKFINIPRKAITIKDIDGVSQYQKPLVEVTMDKKVYDKQDETRQYKDGKEKFVNELETIRGFETVSLNEEAQIITEQDLEILYPKQRQQRSFDFTQAEVDKALSTDKKSKEVIAKGLQPKQGEKVGVRLNLNVLKNKGIPIQTVHQGQVSDKYKRVDGKSGFFGGEAINYAPAVTLKDAYLNTSQRGIYKVKEGITHKTPIASVDGLYQDVSLADTNFDGVEIRFNPMSGGLFVTADGNRPVRSVEEATIVGHRVYGRGKIEYFTEANKPKPYTPEKSFKQRQQLSDGYFIEETGKGEFTLKKGIRYAGDMSIAELQTSKPSVSQVFIRQFDQGKGLAPDMYREIAKAMEDKGKTLVSSKYTNDASQGVWKRLVKDGDAKVIGSRIDSNGIKRNLYEMLPSKPKQRQQKESKPTVEKLSNFYAMDNKGFIKPENVYDLDALKQFASRVGFTVKRHRGDSGATTMYSLRDANDRQFVPVKGTARTRFQKIMDKFDNPVNIIQLAREAGYSNKEISYFLKTRKGLKVKEIKELMEVKIDMFESMPSIFGEIPGGLIAGSKLYEATMNKFNALVSKNSKLPKGKQKSISSLINESIEFMMTLRPYKTATEGVKSKTLASTLQQKLQASMQEALGGNEVKDVSKTITNLKKLIREKIRGAREIRDVKRQLQRAIREIMPKSEYSKGEVMSLLRTIQEAEPAWLKGNLRNLIQQVEEMGAKKNVSILDAAIKKILDKKFEVTVGGKKVVVKIDGETAKIIAAIKDKLYKADEIQEDIIQEQTKIMESIKELNEKLELTEQEETDLLILNIALGINSSKLMEDNNPRKADQLAQLYNDLKALITIGRNNFKDAAKERSDRYAANTTEFYKALTNTKEDVDLRDPEVKEKILAELKARRDSKKSTFGKTPIGMHLNYIKENMMGFLKKGTQGLSQLSSELDKSPGAQFDGFIKDFIYRRVNKSTRVYKESEMALNDIFTEKSQEYLGKDYKKKIKKYREKLNFEDPQLNKYLKDPKAVKEAKDKFDNDPTSENEKNYNETMRRNIPFADLTPLQLQYLYFQYKQSDTHAGFGTALGENFESIMDGLSEHFETTYPDLLALGQWQVDVLLPSLYEKYNKVYKKIYNTDLPQRDNYSGKTFRLVEQKDGTSTPEITNPLSLFGENGTSQMSMNVIGNSTLLRKNNDLEIMPVDAYSAIWSYVKDMEHFTAYAENMNEISKVFNNEIIKKEIIAQHGMEVYEAINLSLMATAQRGANQSDLTVNFTNGLSSVFIFNKLALGFTVYLKQLTSVVTYGNYIGYGNWSKTAATMGPKEWIKTWKEISEDSVYLKYRYYQQISKTIEAYSESAMEEYTPGDQGDKIVRALMFNIKAGDKQAILLGGIPNYVFLKKKYEKTMSPEAAKKKALIMFEEQTKEVQQSSDKQDKDALQNQGGFIQVFNMFMSAPKAYLRQIFGGYRELGRNLKDGSGKGSTFQNARTIALFQFGLPMLFQWVGSGFPFPGDDWDEEDTKDQFRAAGLSVFNSIFVLGQILEAGADLATDKPWWDDFTMFPIFNIVRDIGKAYLKTQNKNEEKSLESWRKLVYAFLPITALGGVPGKFAGAPFLTAEKLAKNIEEIINGGGSPKEVMLRLFNYSDYVIEGGKKETKPKGKKLNKTEMRKYFPELMEAQEELENSPEIKEIKEMQKEMKAEEKAMREEMLDQMFDNN